MTGSCDHLLYRNTDKLNKEDGFPSFYQYTVISYSRNKPFWGVKSKDGKSPKFQ